MRFMFVFPGQGSQSVGMMASYEGLPAIRETFAEASDVLGEDLWEMAQSGPAERLSLTVNTQPLMLTAGVAVWRAWRALGGPEPALLAGHSLGEYTALVAAESLSFADALPLVRLRAQAMQEAVPAGVGAMAAVIGAEDELVVEVCEQASASQVVVPANYNSPGQVVIGGDAAAVDRAIALLNERGVRKVVKLAVSVPSHTPLMREAANRLAATMRGMSWKSPSIPVVQNVDAQVHDGIDDIRDALVRQLYLPVRWTDCTLALKAKGAIRIAECGPGKVLTGLVKRIDKSLEARSLATPGDFQSAIEEWKQA